MLRIDETAGTLVAPGDAFGDEPALPREELAALLRAGWPAFATEIGRPELLPVPASLPAGLDLLCFDPASGRLTVVVAGSSLEDALRAAATVADWDADDLQALDPTLTAVPGASPRLLLVGCGFDDATIVTLDWLVHNHGLEATAHRVRVVRFGAERLVHVDPVYPAATSVAGTAAGPADAGPLGFVAAMTAPAAEAATSGSKVFTPDDLAALNSAPPPGALA